MKVLKRRAIALALGLAGGAVTHAAAENAPTVTYDGFAHQSEAAAGDSTLSHQASLTHDGENGDKHGHKLATPFPPLTVAVQNQPQFFTPSEAIGKASFARGEKGLIHTQSGMQCDGTHFLSEAGGGAPVEQLFLIGVGVYNPRGNDVGCVYSSEAGDFRLTLFASEWPDISAADHFGVARNLMVTKESPYGQDAPIMVITVEKDDKDAEAIPETLAFGYDSLPNAEGQVLREGLWLAVVKGWHVKLRATHTPPRMPPMILGSIMHTLALLEIDSHDGALSNQLVTKDPETDIVPVSFTAE